MKRRTPKKTAKTNAFNHYNYLFIKRKGDDDDDDEEI